MSYECDLPYPYLFVDELPGYTPPASDSIEHELNQRGRSVSIDNPRYPEGVVTQCPDCKTWWVFRRHATPPGERGGMIMCGTTYKPQWHRVRWRDWALRRRIREAQETR